MRGILAAVLIAGVALATALPASADDASLQKRWVSYTAKSKTLVRAGKRISARIDKTADSRAKQRLIRSEITSLGKEVRLATAARRALAREASSSVTGARARSFSLRALAGREKSGKQTIIAFRDLDSAFGQLIASRNSAAQPLFRRATRRFKSVGVLNKRAARYADKATVLYVQAGREERDGA